MGVGVVAFGENKAVLTLDNGNEIHYKKYNELYFHNETDFDVMTVISTALEGGYERIHLHYGHTKGEKLGLDWMEENSVEGTIGSSMGRLRVPLLIPTRRSSCGPAILDHCIVKITTTGKNKRLLYQHPKYHRPVLSIREIRPDEMCFYHVGKSAKSLRELGLTHTVCFDGESSANFKTLLAAQRYLNKMS